MGTISGDIAPGIRAGAVADSSPGTGSRPGTDRSLDPHRGTVVPEGTGTAVPAPGTGTAGAEGMGTAPGTVPATVPGTGTTPVCRSKERSTHSPATSST